MELKCFRQSFGCLLCNGISPSTERNQQIAIFVKCQITMHHGTETDTCQLLYFYPILFHDILCHLLVAVLQTCPDIIQCICPYSIFQTILPVMRSGCNRQSVFIHQYCFDSCGTELDTEHSFSCCNCTFYITHKIFLLFINFTVCQGQENPLWLSSAHYIMRLFAFQNEHSSFREMNTGKSKKEYIFA